MSCGCKTSGDSAHNCGTKSANGCDNVDTCGNSYKLSVFDWLANVQNPTAEKCNIVEVRFKNDRKQFFKNVNGLPLHIGSIITVESSPGHDVGVVSLTGELVKVQMKKKNVPEESVLKVYRLANQKDIETWHEVRGKEDPTKIQARKIAQHLRLDMKITDVEYQGDGGKVTFYYTAESRVDFRQLIKEFAAAFRTKIDMKQIGFRQEAAKIGGIGSCGRELCCSTWLTDFRSVNTNAARYQQLSINPQKLAGQCGKLKCCLNYELDSYMDALRNFPPTSTTLDTEKGKAFCIKIDVFKRKMWFAYAEHPVAWYDLEIDDVHQMIAQNKKGEKCSPLEDMKAVSPETFAKSTDLIQESSLDRFEHKNRGKGRGRKPDNKKPDNRKRNEDAKGPRPNGQKQNADRRKKSEPRAEGQQAVKTQPRPAGEAGTRPNAQKKKHHPRKNTPKRDNNA